MRCKWPNTRQILWSIIKPSRPGGISYQPSPGTPFLRSTSIRASNPSSYRLQSTSMLSTVAHTTTYPKGVEEVPKKISSLQTQLSAARLSRIACNAIHLALRSPVGGLEDAHLIVNSLRISALRNDPLRSSELKLDLLNGTIDFGREVSPRLSSHALLHGLLRIGHTDQVAGLATTMMEAGIRLNSKTLEAIFHAALPPSQKNRLPQPAKPAQPFNVMLNNSRLSDLSTMTLNKSTCDALLLLGAARNTHHGRTRGMFGTLIAICLINGEIILASLLFGFLVKDWQLKKSLAVRLHEAKGMESDKSSTKGQVDDKHYRVFPTSTWLKQILSPINHALSSDGDDEAFHLSFTSALQALAYLAVLLDHRQLPFANVTSLIRSLYSCPRVDEEVWIVNREGQLQRVKAYPYFHGVLQRLVGTLSTGKNRQGGMLCDLDLASLNALLHYTLRHRLSPAPAEVILQHMEERRSHLKPDIVTYNILLRSGTILRQDSIVRRALKALHLKLGPKDFLMRERTSNPGVPKERKLVSKSSSLNPHRHSLQEHVMPPSAPQTHLEPDNYTISSYIMYLISTGKTQDVVDLVLEMFPEIRPVDAGLLTTSSRAEGIKMRKHARTASVKRAVKLGPYVLTALLNALFKARKTGLMKWVWRLAREAERKSRKSDFVPETDAWFMPVHAYTLMLQCYRLEHKRTSIIPASFRQMWSPRQSREHLLHSSLALYRLMKSRTGKACAAIESGTMPRTVAVPLSDPRFFNTMLALFVVRGHRRSRAHYRHNFRRVRLLHARWGIVSPHWNPVLQEVGEDMVRAGYAIPQGLRHLFVGRWDEGTWNLKRPPELDRRPFAYPRNPLPSNPPFHIPVHRSKGTHPRRKRLWTNNLASAVKD